MSVLGKSPWEIENFELCFISLFPPKLGFKVLQQHERSNNCYCKWIIELIALWFPARHHRHEDRIKTFFWITGICLSKNVWFQQNSLYIASTWRVWNVLEEPLELSLASQVPNQHLDLHSSTAIGPRKIAISWKYLNFFCMAMLRTYTLIRASVYVSDILRSFPKSAMQHRQIKDCDGLGGSLFKQGSSYKSFVTLLKIRGISNCCLFGNLKKSTLLLEGFSF